MCARCSYDPVITKHGRQYAIAAFRRYSIQDDIFFFLSEKHVYACKKCDFNACARWLYDLVITKNQLQHAIAAFRRYSVYDVFFFFSLKNMFIHVKNTI